jgi:elongation factor P--beta-lysine ligase
MDKIYIIESIPGDYDSDPSIIGYIEDKDIAKETVRKLNETLEKAKEWNEKISDYLINVINPSIPEEEREEVPEIPKWKAGISEKEITDEMRSERNRIKALQVEIGERNHEKYLKWKLQSDELQKEYIYSFNIDPEILVMMTNIKMNWIKGFRWIEVSKMK